MMRRAFETVALDRLDRIGKGRDRAERSLCSRCSQNVKAQAVDLELPGNLSVGFLFCFFKIKFLALMVANHMQAGFTQPCYACSEELRNAQWNTHTHTHSKALPLLAVPRGGCVCFDIQLPQVSPLPSSPPNHRPAVISRCAPPRKMCIYKRPRRGEECDAERQPE